MFVAIIVTYYPDVSHVKSMCKEIKASGNMVGIFDNTPKSELDCVGADFILSCGDNLGIAYGFNRCIEYCKNNYKGIEGFVFFDQDSVVIAENLDHLIKIYWRVKKDKIPLGVLGANPIGADGKPYMLRKQKRPEGIPDDLEKVWFVISSFSIVSAETFDKVGVFKEEFFIDLVDSEFSFRCEKHGMINLISINTTFIHEVGVSQFNFNEKRKIAISSPIRNYYQIRNAILVGIEYHWYPYILKLIIKRFVHTLLSGFLQGELGPRMRFYFKGIYHGFSGKTGKYS